MRAVLLAALSWALAVPAMAQKYDFTVRPERTSTQTIVIPSEEFDGPHLKLKPRYLENEDRWFLPPGSSENEKVFGGSLVYRPRRDDSELEVTIVRQFGSETKSSVQGRFFPQQKESKAIFSIKKKFWARTPK